MFFTNIPQLFLFGINHLIGLAVGISAWEAFKRRKKGWGLALFFFTAVCLSASMILPAVQELIWR